MRSTQSLNRHNTSARARLCLSGGTVGWATMESREGTLSIFKARSLEMSKCTVRWITAVLLILSCSKAHAQSCMPELTVRDDQKSCVIDSDCVLYSDSCRSCGAQYAVSTKSLNEVTQADWQSRIKANCIIVCEGCDQSSVKAVCVDNRCLAQKR
jgi:hypothetical protein